MAAGLFDETLELPATATTELPCQAAPALFFADAPADLEMAKALCVNCPIQAECFEGAMRRAEPHGVWGGQLFDNGAVIVRKRPRGRPPKNAAA